MTYTRWGKTSCPNNTDTQLVYSGRAGGTNYNDRGGSADKLCLPNDPEYNIPGSIDLTTSHKSVVHGAEYETSYPRQEVNDHNVPCAVCDVATRARVIVIPAKTTCPPSWTREYYGYLATEYDGHYRSSYSCMDIDQEVIPGTGGGINLSQYYPAVSDCNGLSCPPYVNNRILTCVVCTK